MPDGKTHFLGIDFEGGCIESAIDEILKGTKEPFRFIVTPNVHHVVQLHEGNGLKAVYASAWRVYCDSRILSRLGRMCGVKLDVITGSDLTAALVARASEQHLKVAIIGPSAADCDTLAERFPGLEIASYTPPMGFSRSEAEVVKCVDFVRTASADLVFLAVGMPQQEKLAQRLSECGDVTGIGLCIGASIDFLTEKQRRAPQWVQRFGLEWLHRLLSDPKRLARRYLIECPRIFPLLIAHMMDARTRS